MLVLMGWGSERPYRWARRRWGWLGATIGGRWGKEAGWDVEGLKSAPGSLWGQWREPDGGWVALGAALGRRRRNPSGGGPVERLGSERWKGGENRLRSNWHEKTLFQ